MNRPAIRMTDEVAVTVLNDALRLTGENARLTELGEQLRAALIEARDDWLPMVQCHDHRERTARRVFANKVDRLLLATAAPAATTEGQP